MLGVAWGGAFAVNADVELECEAYKRPADAPYPPLPGPGGSRLVACGGGVVVLTTLEELPPLPPRVDPAFLLTAIYKVGRHAFRDLEAIPYLPRHEFPGSGKLTGEEFRIVERDNDYLRLVGRGGDEYIAWDFVLGTLDTGEWVLMGEDGLYIAKREGDKVVAKWPYRGSVLDVRGPPYMPYYPVIPVKWVREQLEKVGEVARRVGARRWDYYTPPVDPELVLKWPVRSVKWEFVVRPAACEDGLWGPLYGTREAQWFGCEDLCDLDEYLALKYKRRICGRARPE